MSHPKSKDQIYRCSRTGKIISSPHKNRWPWWLMPFIGFGALIWFLVRVIPKPSRATYPCQKVAFPLASGFVAWVLGLIGSAVAFRKARRAFSRARYVTAAVFVAVSIGLIWTVMTSPGQKKAQAHEPIVHNSPMGQGKGIYPGRVVWIHDANAATWPGSLMSNDNDIPPSPYWHEDVCTDPDIVAQMLSKALRTLTGRSSDEATWDAIFKDFNQQVGRGYVGYTPGQKIAIKINFVLMNNNPSNGAKALTKYDQIDNSPQLAIALLKQLIDIVGVSPGNISIGDPSMIMANHWYNMVYAECPGVVYLSKAGYSLTGRTEVTLDTESPFYWSDPITSRTEGKDQDCIPTHFAQSDYFINFPILKSHNDAGITLSGKNHYGSLGRLPYNFSGPQYYYDMHLTRPTSTSGMGHYRANVDLMGHPRLGGKTMLVLVDFLYSGRSWDSRPIRWDMAPFNGEWPSSILLSQDQVAADSVAFDFMDNEWDAAAGTINGYPQYPGTDDYLHEAALVPDPCSGTDYDPNDDGGLTESLGVHEHWNNATNKQYSRNLDPVDGTGIELVTEEGIAGDFYRDGVVDFKDYAVLAAAWGSEAGDANWDAACDMSMPIDGVIDEYDLAALCENWLSE